MSDLKGNPAALPFDRGAAIDRAVEGAAESVRRQMDSLALVSQALGTMSAVEDLLNWLIAQRNQHEGFLLMRRQGSYVDPVTDAAEVKEAFFDFLCGDK